MGNTLLTPSIIAREAIAQLYSNTVMAGLVHRDYSDEFAKIGDTVTVRKPTTFVSQEYNGSTITVQEAAETSVAVKLDTLLDVSFAVTSKEMTLDVKDFSEQLITPAMEAHVQKIDQLLLGLYPGIAQYGTIAGTPAISDLAELDRILNDAKAPLGNRHLVLNPTAKSKYGVLDEVIHAEKSGSTAALREASIGKLQGFNTYMDQNVCAHTYGTAASAKAAGTAGESTLTMTNVVATTATFEVGDLITANGHQHVVTEKMTAVDGGGTLKVYPAVPETFTAAAITVNSGKAQNLAFHKNALALVSRPLAAPLGAKSESISYNGLGCRVVYGYNMNTKTDTISIDMLVGVKILTPELAVRFIG